MVVLKGEALSSFRQDPRSQGKAIVLHGSDRGQIRELARAIVEANAGSLDDPFTVIRLSELKLAEDKSALADAAGQIALGGGRCVVWIDDAGKAFTEQLAPLLESPAGGLIVAEAGALAKSSALRKLAESHQDVIAIGCYETTNHADMVRKALAGDNLTITPEALALLEVSLAGDMALARAQMEKLALYALGESRIEVDHVEAICGDPAETFTSEFIDLTFAGRRSDAIAALLRITDAGNQPGQSLSALLRHRFVLEHLHAAMARGVGARRAISQARPPIFFRRHGAVETHLRLWPPEKIRQGGKMLAKAVLETRKSPALAAMICERATLSMTSLANRRV